MMDAASFISTMKVDSPSEMLSLAPTRVKILWLERGGSEHSFGIHVAKLAGMPSVIVNRANAILHRLETNRDAAGAVDMTGAESPKPLKEGGMQLSFFQLDDPVLSQIRDEIIGLDINNLSPLEALNKLNDIRSIITGKP